MDGQAGQYILSWNRDSGEKRSFFRPRAPSIANVFEGGEDVGDLGGRFVERDGEVFGF